MVWLIQNDCDYEGAQCLLCPDRYHFLEIPALMAPHVREEIRQGNNPVSKRLMFTAIQERAKPWFVKTHLPLHFCPPSLLQKGKVGMSGVGYIWSYIYLWADPGGNMTMAPPKGSEFMIWHPPKDGNVLTLYLWRCIERIEIFGRFGPSQNTIWPSQNVIWPPPKHSDRSALVSICNGPHQE